MLIKFAEPRRALLAVLQRENQVLIALETLDNVLVSHDSSLGQQCPIRMTEPSGLSSDLGEA